MPPSIDTGECEKKVVEVVNTEELPLNAPETGDEAKAKPEDTIAEEENKNDKTEESAETEKNISELAQPEGDSTPPVVVDQTPPGEMPGNAGEVKEEKCEDLVEEEVEQNKPQLAVAEVRTEETSKEPEQSQLESNEKSTGETAEQKPVPAETEAKEILGDATDDKSEVDVKEPQNLEQIAEESEKPTGEMETSDINPGQAEIEAPEPEIIENKSEESDKSSSENETSKDLKEDQTDIEGAEAEPQVKENKTDPKEIERENLLDKAADSTCGDRQIPDTILEEKTASNEENETQCGDIKADTHSEPKATESNPVTNQEKEDVVEDTTNQEKETEQMEKETPIKKEIPIKTEEVQESHVTMEQPSTSEDIKPEENLKEAEVKEETKAEVKLTSTTVESTEKDAASEGGDYQSSPTLSKNSYDATKEEIEDSINFIKNRLSVADPKIPGGTMNEENIKKVEEDPQPPSETDEDSNKEHGETNLVVKKEEIEIPKEEVKIPQTNAEVENPKTNTEVENPKTNTEVEVENSKTNTEVTKKEPEEKIPNSSTEGETPPTDGDVESPKPDPDLELAVIECIPPVRPERQKKASVKIPEWSPPKNNFFSYLFGCFKPRDCD